MTVTFADEQGNPVGDGAQTVKVLGLAWHPDAYADRVSSCPDPPAPLPPCPGDANGGPTFVGPSCAFTLQCLRDGGGMGMHSEHDIGIGYLEADPVGIDPIPVVVGEQVATPTQNLVAFPGINAWLDTHPIVTSVGYGGGSFEWPAPGGGKVGGRDFGTARVKARISSVPYTETCGSNDTTWVDKPYLVVDAPNPDNVWVAGGDSGGPTLVGPGLVPSGMDQPTPLPQSSGLSPRRYQVAVQSRDADYTDDNGKLIQAGANAVTFDAGNGSWLLSRFKDIDGDGVPNNVDNCVSIPNSDQANCNIDAEHDRQGDVLGDACDPVPCPKAKAPVQAEYVLSANIKDCQGTKTVRRLRSQILPTPLGSSNPLTGTVVSQFGVRTAVRFCQRDALKNSTCKIDDNQRREGHFYYDAVSPGVNPWLRVSLDALATGTDTFYSYPSSGAPMSWQYWSDRTAWIAKGWITDPGTPTKPANLLESSWGSSSKLDGVLGLHAGTQAFPPSTDLLGTQYLGANGIHATPDLGDGYGEGAGLGRHYLDIAPDAVEEEFVITCLTCQPPCLAGDLLKKFRFCPYCGRPRLWWPGGDPVDGLLAPMPSGGWGLIDESGQAVGVDSMLSQSLKAKLADSSLRYVAAAEPYAGIGATNSGFVQAAFVSADGTDVDSLVTITPEGLFQAQGRTGIAAQAHQQNSTTTMAARSQFVPVFSQVSGAVFVVGGRLAGLGDLAHDIWALPAAMGPGGTPRQLVFPDYQPESVLAATVSSTDGALWVLDEKQVGLAKTARLVRLDVPSGKSELVWQGPRLGFFDAFYLAVDRDGQVLLFGSSAKIQKHFTVRFEATPFALGTAHPVLLRFDQGRLAGEPLIDSAGYFFVTLKGNKNKLAAERLADLGQKPGHVVDLSGCF